MTVDDALEVAAHLQLPDDLSTTDVTVEAVYGRPSGERSIQSPVVVELSEYSAHDREATYRGAIAPEHSGNFVVGVRVRPFNALLVNPHETGRVRWA